MWSVVLLILMVSRTLCFEQNDTQTTINDNLVQEATVISKNHTFERWYCFDGAIPNATFLKQCCSNEIRKYRRNWYKGAYYLTSILERLHRWECTEFHEECSEPTWPYTEFTNLIYELFCNRSHLESSCILPLENVVRRYNFTSETSQWKEKGVEYRWTMLKQSLKSAEMQLTDLVSPCVQVALFDRSDGGVGRFHEIIEPLTPFCGVQWNGYDYNTAMHRNVSPWTGIPSWCKGSIIVCMVVIVMAGIATIFANIVILAVFGRTPELRNSQTIYKISLAISDLSVGLIIWPNMIVMQYQIFFAPRIMGDLVKQPSENNGSWTAYFPVGDEGLVRRYPGGNFRSIFSTDYISFIGFFTSLSLFLSIYVLMIASFDRFSAVFRPLKHNKHVAKRYAKIICYILWLIAGILATLPIVIMPMRYRVSLSIFIISEGNIALVVLFIGLFFPLLTTWIVTIATYSVSKKQTRNRPGVVIQSGVAEQNSIERRVARTLMLMVGTFTLCVTPAILCILVGFYQIRLVLGLPKTFDHYAGNVYITAEHISVIILTSNSLWNCFIYGFRTRGFRKAARKVFDRFLVKSGLRYLWGCIMSGVQRVRRLREASISTNSGGTMEIATFTTTRDCRDKP